MQASLISRVKGVHSAYLLAVTIVTCAINTPPRRSTHQSLPSHHLIPCITCRKKDGRPVLTLNSLDCDAVGVGSAKTV